VQLEEHVTVMHLNAGTNAYYFFDVQIEKTTHGITERLSSQAQF
jgi:hypothetical protein